MKWFSKKNDSKSETFLQVYSKNLVENSKFINYSLITSKLAIVPLSKIIDYTCISLITIFVYKYLNH